MSTPVKMALLALALIAVWWMAMSPSAAPYEPAAESGSDAPPAEYTVRPPEAQPAPPVTAQIEQPAPVQEPSAPSAAPEPAPEPAPSVNVPMRQGPVPELSLRFAAESRGASSEQDEARVRSAFDDPAIPAALLDSVECRRGVCRTVLRWSPERDAAYVLGLTKAVGSFSAPLAIEGAGAPDADGVSPVVVYFSFDRK
jgi:hypothetical protein